MVRPRGRHTLAGDANLLPSLRAAPPETCVIIFARLSSSGCQRHGRDVPLLERAGGIIHVAFVFVKTLTKRCLPAWRPFHLHSRRLVRDNLVLAATSRRMLSLLSIATCCSIASAETLSVALSAAGCNAVTRAGRFEAERKLIKICFCSREESFAPLSLSLSLFRLSFSRVARCETRPD